MLLGLLQNLKDQSSSAEICDWFIVSIIFICHIDSLSIMRVFCYTFNMSLIRFLQSKDSTKFAKVDHEACGFMSCNKDFLIIIFWGHSMSENSKYKCNWAKYHLSLVLHHYYKTIFQTCVVQFLLKIDYELNIICKWLLTCMELECQQINNSFLLWKEFANEFESPHDIPYVVGVIDESQIPIIAPKFHLVGYYNRKGFHFVLFTQHCYEQIYFWRFWHQVG